MQALRMAKPSIPVDQVNALPVLDSRAFRTLVPRVHDFLSVLKKLSITALSQQLAFLLIN